MSKLQVRRGVRLLMHVNCKKSVKNKYEKFEISAELRLS